MPALGLCSLAESWSAAVGGLVRFLTSACWLLGHNGAHSFCNTVFTPTDSAGTSFTSFTFQFAFGLAITNASCPGLALTPGSYEVAVSAGSSTAAAAAALADMPCMPQVVYNLPGNPAHLAMTCSGRQQPFEVRLGACRRRAGCRGLMPHPHSACRWTSRAPRSS